MVDKSAIEDSSDSARDSDNSDSPAVDTYFDKVGWDDKTPDEQKKYIARLLARTRKAETALKTKKATNTADDGGVRSLKIEPDFIRSLADVLDSTGLSEIEVADGPRRIRIARILAPTLVAAASAPAVAGGSDPAVAPTPSSSPGPSSAPGPSSGAQASLIGGASPIGGEATDIANSPPDRSKTVTSPMVGTAYLAPDPESADFAAVGSRVEIGDTILIIEAMKVMNPIIAPTAGVVTDIFVENNQPIEYDQPLFIIA